MLRSLTSERHPNMQTRPLEQAIDDLQVGDIDILPDDMLCLQLTHGSEYGKEQATQALHDSLHYGATEYLDDIEEFLTAGPESGNTDIVYVDTSGIDAWFAVMAEYLPAETDGVLVDVVDALLSHYDRLGFTAAKEAFGTDIVTNAQELAKSVAYSVAMYSLRPETIESCASSAFMKDHGGQEAYAVLAYALLRLGENTRAEQYEGYVVEQAAHVTSSEFIGGIACDIAVDHPDLTIELYHRSTDNHSRVLRLAAQSILALAADERSTEHTKALNTLESFTQERPGIYLDFISWKQSHGAVSKENLTNLIVSAEQRHTTMSGRMSKKAIELLPDDLFLKLVDSGSRAVYNIDTFKQGALRLVSMGMADKAEMYVQQMITKSREIVITSLDLGNAYLMLYRINGNEEHWQEAQTCFDRMNGMLWWTHPIQAKANQLAAAYAQQDQEHIKETLKEVKILLAETDVDKRSEAYTRALRMYIEEGLVDDAEALAIQLRADTEIREKCSYEYWGAGKRVVDALAKAGKLPEAKTFLVDFFMTKKPYPKQTVDAIAALKL